jgi:sulfate transport system substrate-binding protein
MIRTNRRFPRLALAAAVVMALSLPAMAQERSLTNVSYDPTRELYAQFNAEFVAHWKETTGETVSVQATHSGSGAQARSVLEGLPADVVTLALESDINVLADAGLLREDWLSALPNNSAPYVSTIVFLVRKGNPKGIADWGDLVKDGVEVITPNPKTSGGARWNFLAAWAWAKAQPGGSDDTAKDYVAELFRHVPVLDTGARGSTLTFAQRGLGDVLLAWENEAYLTLREMPNEGFEIVTPSISIRAEPPVAIVDSVVDRRGTRDLAQAYLDYLYSDEGQAIAAANFYRPLNPAAANPEDVARFGDLNLVTIEDFGGWREAQPFYFGDGGVFDQIFEGSEQ